MSVNARLVGFGLRQVIGDFADNVVQVVAAAEQRFRDHSQTLPKANPSLVRRLEKIGLKWTLENKEEAA